MRLQKMGRVDWGRWLQWEIVSVKNQHHSLLGKPKMLNLSQQIHHGNHIPPHTYFWYVHLPSHFLNSYRNFSVSSALNTHLFSVFLVSSTNAHLPCHFVNPYSHTAISPSLALSRAAVVMQWLTRSPADLVVVFQSPLSATRRNHFPQNYFSCTSINL